jgi:hypothetical protein
MIPKAEAAPSFHYMSWICVLVDADLKDGSQTTDHDCHH